MNKKTVACGFLGLLLATVAAVAFWPTKPPENKEEMAEFLRQRLPVGQQEVHVLGWEPKLRALSFWVKYGGVKYRVSRVEPTKEMSPSFLARFDELTINRVFVMFDDYDYRLSCDLHGIPVKELGPAPGEPVPSVAKAVAIAVAKAY